ncbi:MAG: DUF6029 family protein [Bacteroidia bacterium]
MKRFILLALTTSLVYKTYSQNNGSITGNVQSIVQYYTTDTLIGAFAPKEQAAMNSFANVNYNNGKFSAGVRFESYLPTLLGYPQRFNGTGIGYRYARYADEHVDVTIGSIYEQFGSGMLLRTYEEPQLGLENQLDGMRVVYRPTNGVTLKGVYGKQRFNFSDKVEYGPGIVRGFDGEISINDLIKKFNDSDLKVSLGGSFVSKYQAASNDTLILPENVGAYGGRLNISYKDFYLNSEYVIKENDPSATNSSLLKYQYIYNQGYGAFINLGYSMKGLGITLQGKSIDNMSFRSDRDALNTDLFINYLPALTKTHTYNLAATLYPYATVPYGEVAYQVDVFYKFQKNTLLGGKYGTMINANYAIAYDINRTILDDFSAFEGRLGYTSTPFNANMDSIFFQDFNVEIKKKINDKLSGNINYFNFVFNPYANPVTKYDGYIYSNIGVIDITYKINKKHSIRTELQGLWTEQDQGNWATGIIEYSISPHWFFAVLDQYNYGNPDEHKQLHYLLGSFGYIHNSTRFTIMYGKQRAGIFCIGGICRAVPASNGVTLTFTTSF